MEYYIQHKGGIIGTVIFHVIVLIMLLFFEFLAPSYMGIEGILVNFGNSDNGFGEIEPGPGTGFARNNNVTVQQVQREEVAVPLQPQTLPSASTSRQETAREPVVTQNQEQTAAVDTAERTRREEAERRQRQLEEERQQIAEAARLEQQRINEINSRTQSAFSNSSGASSGGGGGTGPGGLGTGTDPNQGITFPSGGNQGVPTGDPNASNYGPGGSGLGTQGTGNGTGVSFSLTGRVAMSLPKPDYSGNDDGVVIVRITVDKNGNVTAAEPGGQGTTIMGSQFWNEARQAALKAKFSVNENAPVQNGTITYRFIRN